MNAHIDSIMAEIPASNPKLSQISKAQDQDKVCQQVKKYCAENWPDKEHDIKPYYQVNGELTVVHGLLTRGTRIMIPNCLQVEDVGNNTRRAPRRQ